MLTTFYLFVEQMDLATSAETVIALCYVGILVGVHVKVTSLQLVVLKSEV